MSADVIHGDCVEVLSRMAAGSVDAVICDPPYGLAFMGKEFDTLGDGPAQQAWHHRWLIEAFHVLRPGGTIKAFCGTRTYHRLAAAMVEAGFVGLRLEAWVYGSGFPKSHDMSKSIDKMDKAEASEHRARAFTAWMRSTGITAQQINETTGTFMGSHYLTDKSQPAVATADLFDLLRPLLPPVPEEIEALVHSRTVESENMKRRKVINEREMSIRPGFAGEIYGGDGTTKSVPITEAHTDAARRWSGWGTALKPAWEPVLVGMKP